MVCGFTAPRWISSAPGMMRRSVPRGVVDLHVERPRGGRVERDARGFHGGPSHHACTASATAARARADPANIWSHHAQNGALFTLPCITVVTKEREQPRIWASWYIDQGRTPPFVRSQLALDLGARHRLTFT